MHVPRLQGTVLLICAAMTSGGCARIHESRTAKPYEDAEVTHRTHLAEEGLLQLGARQDGTRLEVWLATVQLCRDEVTVSRGVEVTRKLERSTAAATAEWLALGGTTALALASYSAATSTRSCDVWCSEQVVGAAGMFVFVPAAIVTGFIVLIDSYRAEDEVERVEQARSRSHRIAVCGRTPTEGARVRASAEGSIDSAVIDSRGKAHLDLALRLHPQQETTVELVLDGVKLGSVPISSQWRSWLIRRNTP